MTQEEKLEIFTDTFNLNNDIDITTPLNKLEDWDSMSKLSIVVIFKDYCNRKISLEELNAFVTIEDVLNAMD